PVEAVDISIVGTNVRTVSGARGEFVLVGVPEGTPVIRAERIGYTTVAQAVTVVAGQTVVVNLSLQSNAIALDELVVVGYGTQQRRALSSSVASVSADEISNVPL